LGGSIDELRWAAAMGGRVGCEVWLLTTPQRVSLKFFDCMMTREENRE
jgi:hypothetical protein